MPKSYRVGVIGRTGRGNYGHGLDTVWLEIPGAEIVGVADDDKAGLASATERLKARQAFADYRQMLDQTKPEIVSIGPRWLDMHHEIVLECAARGIHMYLEKPLCRTLAEADEMVAACERSHVKLAIATQTRYSPMIPVVKQLIADGKIGQVLEYRGRGKEDPRGGGEDMWVLGTHIMDLIRNFGGQPTSCFGTVSVGGRPIQKSDVVEGREGIGPLAGDCVNAMYTLPGGVAAYFGSARNAAGRPARFGLQIFGSAGVLEIGTGHLPITRYLGDPGWGRGGKPWQIVSTAGIGEPETFKDRDQHFGNVLAIKDLLTAIEEDRQPLASIYEARGATEMIVAVFESQRLAAPVSLPMKQRQNPLTLLS